MTSHQNELSQKTSTLKDTNAGTQITSTKPVDALMESSTFDNSVVTPSSRIDDESVSALMEPLTTTDHRASVPRRKFRPLRFMVGLTLTTAGVSLILWIAIRMLDVHYLGGRFALALVAIVVMSSVMMLGGGFGLMATAAAGFDDHEFDRLIRSGNISAAEMVMTQSSNTDSSGSPTHRNAA